MTRLDSAIERGKRYLFNGMDERGLWRDFKTETHGYGTDWITGYVGLFLIRAGEDPSRLEDTARTLVDRQSDLGGWGYNHTVPPEPDSTSFVVRFLDSFVSKEYFWNPVKRGEMFLSEHQLKDGSFPTYSRKILCATVFNPILAKIRFFDPVGWYSGIPDVTATAVQALTDHNRIYKACEYLRETQLEDGSWHAYWWTDDSYATVHATEALAKHGFQNEVELAEHRLSRWDTAGSPFYQSLIARALAGRPGHKTAVDAKIRYVINKQQEDGSWGDDYPILRFPHIRNRKPWEDKRRHRKDEMDINRFFTTATAVEALHKYRESC